MRDDYRTEPLEFVTDTRTGVITVELRGALDREARAKFDRYAAANTYRHVCYGCGQAYWSFIPLSPAFSAHVSECIGNKMPTLEWPEFEPAEMVLRRVREATWAHSAEIERRARAVAIAQRYGGQI